MPKTPIPTIESHTKAWRNCTRCHLSQTRCNVVFGRGSIPARVLFIGEAPGDSEDMLGQPFVGPAGQTFDKIVERAIPDDVTWCVTNIVACIPRNEDGQKDGEPGYDEIKACSPRLREFVKIVNPELIVAVGDLAETYLAQGMKDTVVPFTGHLIHITHPSAINRKPWAQRGLIVQQMVIRVAKAVEKMLAGAKPPNKDPDRYGDGNEVPF